MYQTITISSKMRTNTDYTKAIMDLLGSKQKVNIKLAFLLLSNQNFHLHQQLSIKLQQYPLPCLEHGFEMEYLHSLEKLYLNWKELQELPQKLFYLKNLKNLILSDNSLTSIPWEISKLKKLEVLNLYGNRLTQFPKEILELPNLRVLYLGGNQIQEIPPEIEKLTKLQALDIRRSRVTQLPSEFSHLKNMRELACEGSHIHRKDLHELKRRLPNCEIYA
ncbi:MAG TPA: hypothetical protein DCS93_09990 [Microscillaceae bacterium]|nr:hypothetical protein [Microscillaceae bacterium]